MSLNKTELEVLTQTAEEKIYVKQIARTLNKSESQIYRTINSLVKKDILAKTKEGIVPIKNTHVSLLLQILNKHPQLTGILFDSAITILISLFSPKKVSEVAKETSLKEITIYKATEKFRRFSIVRKDKNRYFFNNLLWGDLKEFLKAYEQYNLTTDPRVPANSVIYYKNSSEIVYSNLGKQKAALTAFSAYEQYGIKLLTITNYYYLPAKKLFAKEIFIHSLYVVEKEKDVRNLTFIGLFYLKNKEKLRGIKHIILESLNQVLEGRKIDGYPTLNELKETAEVYDIQILNE